MTATWLQSVSLLFVPFWIRQNAKRSFRWTAICRLNASRVLMKYYLPLPRPLLVPLFRISGSEFDRREKNNCVVRTLLAAFRSPLSRASVWSEVRTHSPGQCVISADKNITQATPPKVVPWGGGGGDDGGMEIFVDPFRVIGPAIVITPRGCPASLILSHSLAPGQIIPCDLPQPQRNWSLRVSTYVQLISTRVR